MRDLLNINSSIERDVFVSKLKVSDEEFWTAICEMENYRTGKKSMRLKFVAQKPAPHQPLVIDVRKTGKEIREEFRKKLAESTAATAEALK